MMAASPHAPASGRQDRIDRVLELVLNTRTRSPANHLPKRLNGLFLFGGLDLGVPKLVLRRAARGQSKARRHCENPRRHGNQYRMSARRFFL